MRRKKEFPPPPAKDVTEIFTMHDVRMGQIQIQTTLDEVLRECKALRLDERSHTELMIRQMKAMVMMTPPPSPVMSFILRETLDKEGKVMTREFIPVPVPRRSV